MPETATKNYSVLTPKALYRVPANAVLKYVLPVGIQYVIYWFFTAVINATLLHGRLDAWTAAIGVTAVAYMLRHFYRHLTKPSLLESISEVAKLNAILQAAAQAHENGVDADAPSAYL